MKDYFTKINNLSMLSSIIFVIIGVILIFNPEGTIKIISYFLGALFFLMGMVKIFNYLSDKKDRNTYFKYDLCYGIIMMLIGLFSLTATEFIVSMFRIVVGIWIVYSGFLRLIYVFRLKVYKEKICIIEIFLSTVIIICGIIILCSPGILLATIGVFILFYSIIDLVESYIFSNNIKRL